MEENNAAAAKVKEPVSNKPSFGAKCKEWFRKQMVSLKRHPQRIAMIFVIVASVYNLLCLTTYSHAIVTYGSAIDWLGLLVFVNTLFSILVFVAFLNSFPKLKPYGKKSVITVQAKSTKVNINLIMYVVTFAMLIAMIVCEILYINLLNNWLSVTDGGQSWYNTVINTGSTEGLSSKELEQYNLFTSSRTDSIVHIILLAIALVITALIPLYTQLIARINTSKEIESAVSNMKEIDLAEDE